MCNAVPDDAPDVTRIPAIQEQFLELAGVMDLKLFVSGWFHDAPFEVRAWLLTATPLSVDPRAASCATLEGLPVSRQPLAPSKCHVAREVSE